MSFYSTAPKDNTKIYCIGLMVLKQTSPETLSHIVSEAIKETEIKYDCKIVVKSNASFQPGYPKPTHRITD